jgi:hypothetical protein
VDTFAKRPGFAGLFSFLGGFLKHHFGSLCRNHMPRLWPRPPRPCRFASAAVMEKDARTPIPERRRRTGQAGSRVVSRGVTAGKAVPALILGKPPKSNDAASETEKTVSAKGCGETLGGESSHYLIKCFLCSCAAWGLR